MLTKLKPLSASIADLPLSGTLEDFSARVLLLELNRLKFDGVLILRMKEKTKKLWIAKGEVFRIQSNLKAELFGQMAVERQWIKQDELDNLLESQKRSADAAAPRPKLGALLQVKASLTNDQLLQLQRRQFVTSLFQAISWNRGTFEVKRMQVNEPAPAPMSLKDLMASLEAIFDQESEQSARLLKIFDIWPPATGLISLSDYPVWTILAGCQLRRTSGILTIRKGTKLFEIVIKDGIPMIFYEGTFQRPRQTVVVRQTSEEHEAFFQEQVLKCFTLISGNASFRTFDIPLAHVVAPEPIESTQVVSASDEVSISRPASRNPFARFVSRVIRIFHFR
jgi:hypothetical protein